MSSFYFSRNTDPLKSSSIIENINFFQHILISLFAFQEYAKSLFNRIWRLRHVFMRAGRLGRFGSGLNLYEIVSEYAKSNRVHGENG